MSGSSRSGRRKTDAGSTKKTAPGKPKRPEGMTRDEAWYWDQCIAKSGHLGAVDLAAAKVCCELWAFYRAAVAAAKDNPCDPTCRCAVIQYSGQLDRAAARLSLDPLGRERMKQDVETPEDVLAEFGIVG